MSLRQVDIYLPRDYEDLPLIGKEHNILDRRTIVLTEERKLVRVLINVENTEAFVEWLHEHIGPTEDYRIVLTAVEATLPRPATGWKKEKVEYPEKVPVEETTSVARLSREELYQEVSDEIRVTKIHYILVALSTIVAATGMLRDSVAIVVGAMVIAPLMAPNIALALGTALADIPLLWRAFKVNLLGFLLALALSVGIGLLLPIDPLIPEIASRTSVNLSDIALALAAGVAGTLSVTRGVSTALIGVMVAVALLPPAAALGMLIGAGNWPLAWGAGLLTLINIVAVNLASVLTFIAQGVEPMHWHEVESARTSTRIAIALWLVALGLLMAAIILSEGALL